MREPLIMHTTLALAGIGWLASVPDPGSSMRWEVLHQKSSAIKAVNYLLSFSSISDTLIAGVANLANVAVSAPSEPPKAAPEDFKTSHRLFL